AKKKTAIGTADWHWPRLQVFTATARCDLTELSIVNATPEAQGPDLKLVLHRRHLPCARSSITSVTLCCQNGGSLSRLDVAVARPWTISASLNRLSRRGDRKVIAEPSTFRRVSLEPPNVKTLVHVISANKRPGSIRLRSLTCKLPAPAARRGTAPTTGHCVAWNVAALYGELSALSNAPRVLRQRLQYQCTHAPVEPTAKRHPVEEVGTLLRRFSVQAPENAEHLDPGLNGANIGRQTGSRGRVCSRSPAFPCTRGSPCHATAMLPFSSGNRPSHRTLAAAPSRVGSCTSLH
ncbi:hypothetical protein CSPX01_04512, partial [Colletotrichum filicis]